MARSIFKVRVRDFRGKMEYALSLKMPAFIVFVFFAFLIIHPNHGLRHFTKPVKPTFLRNMFSERRMKVELRNISSSRVSAVHAMYFTL